LIQLQVPTDPDRPREYSIASLPADGAVHLLIRLELHPDGGHGAASGWLSHELLPGATVPARLRAHSNFREGDNVRRDLILIGNGTGLAGLRSHLKQRANRRAASAAAQRHWLIYGERNASRDQYYRAELEGWQQDGLLTYLDYVYSRDGGPRRYVQDLLRAEAVRVRDWVQRGAAFYVCGSLQGMAAGVDAALREILGSAAVADLSRAGRYRRDVY
jgi:sulfite reductase (NADPH) flavoprotein alpha-component